MSLEADDVRLRAAARVGQVLRGKWRLDRLLGVGGTACVYAATHRNGQRGALKLLRPEHASDPESRQRFLREGYVANRVEHPGAVAVLDDDVAEDGSVFLVMELLEGETLEDRVRTRAGHRLPPGDVAAIADKLLDTLASAHDKGIVHRDLKPENVFLTRAGAIKILDFGIARLRDTPSAGRLTEVGSIMGTPAFMPPEQALGHTATIDARTDIWALGAVLFYALTGRVIHEADTVNKVLLSAMTRPAPKLATVLPGLPGAFCEVVDKALAFQQADRWPDARSMQKALRAVIPQLPAALPLGPSPAGASPPHGALATGSPFSRDATGAGARSSKLTIVAAVSLVFVAGGLGAFVIVSRDKPAPAPAASAPIASAEASSPPSAAPSASTQAPPPPSAATSTPDKQPEEAITAAPQATAPSTGVVRPAGTTGKPIKPAGSGTKPGSDKDLFNTW
jgi:serine/threonine-protein kinase